jgi:ABC-type transport system involved in multi-copper enzyme maturation permease subunit
MQRRWGLGPVFFYEWLTASRRWQLFFGRAAFVAFLLAALLLVGWRALDFDPPVPPNVSLDARKQLKLAILGENLFYGIMGVQLSLLLLAAPAATAGTVCHDKTRGGLIQLLVTDLSDAEIVLGKLAGRLLPVLSLILAGAPVLFLGMLLGGIDPVALLGATLISLGLAVFVCSQTLFLSVWGTRTHEVLLATYSVLAVLLLFAPAWWMLANANLVTPVPLAVHCANPFWLAFAPYVHPGMTDMTEPVCFLAGTLALSAMMMLVAVARLRSVAVRQMGRPGRSRFRWSAGGRRSWLPGPSLDNNPVLWREWHRRRSWGWGRLLGGVFLFFAAGFSLLAIGLALLGNDTREVPALVNGFQVAIGLLFVSVFAVTCLAEERVRGSLDVLLTTPLPTWKIVWGKWWGAFREVPRLAVLPTLVAAALACRNGRWGAVFVIAGLVLAYGTAVTSLGLGLAVWVNRQGRAVALSVSLYVLVTVGWIFVAFTLFPGGVDEGGVLASASPFYGPGLLTAHLERYVMNLNDLALLDLVWVLLYALAGWLLLAVVQFSFDRQMGRARQRWQPRKAAGSTRADRLPRNQPNWQEAAP